ncbi:MAG: hypothetical protein WDN69_12145 [Aliidongia sp.]
MKRAELYALVWEKPVTHVAKEFGISDVAVRKICIKHGIPTPPMGYWAKLQHGKRVVQTPLPPLKPGQADRVVFHAHPKPDLPPEIAETHRIAVQEEAQDGNRISIPSEPPTRLHPLAAATGKALRNAKADAEGFIACSGAGRFDATVGRASIDRVVLLIHWVLRAAVERGHQLSADGDFRIVVDEQPLAVRIYETKGKKSHVPTPAELKRQAEQDEWRKKYPDYYRSDRTLYPTWDYCPSGRLALEISDPRLSGWQSNSIVGRWYDRSTRRVEDYLTEMMIALKTGGATARHLRAQEAEAARLAKEAAERHRENERQRRLLEKVTAFLMEKADKHAQLVKLENLAAHLGMGSACPSADKHPELHRAIEFVLVNLRNGLSADAMNEEINRARILHIESWW